MSSIEELCAMTTERMLRLAIYDHQREFRGKLPKRIEMHPAVFSDLMQDENFHKYRNIANSNSPDEFYGVPVVVDVMAKRLKLVNINNEVEYI